jgi:hypothetical protein
MIVYAYCVNLMSLQTPSRKNDDVKNKNIIKAALERWGRKH